MARRHRLEPLLRPRSVAVVGAAATPGNLGGRVTANLRAARFAGPIYPVHPREAAVHGLPTVDDVSRLPSGVDCVVIGVAAARVPDLMRACLDRGARSFVLLCNGFAEAGTPEGLALDEQVRRLLQGSGAPVCGPNCMGMASVHSGALCYSGRLDHRLPAPGSVAVVSQSGSVSLGFLENGRGVRFSYVVSTGNELNVGAAEYLDFLANDPHTRTICCFIEEVRDGAGFAAALRQASAAGKRVLLLKAGRSAAGARQVRSHTGALAGRSAVFDAVARKHGAALAADLDDMLTACDLLARGRGAAGRGVAAIAGSGGELALVADLAAASGLDARALVDVWGKGNIGRETIEEAIGGLLDSPDVDSLLLINDLGRGNPYVLNYARAAASAFPPGAGKPAIFCSNFVQGLDDEALDVLRAQDVPHVRTVSQAMRVLALLQPPVLPQPDAAAPRPFAVPARPLNEHEAKALLRELGIATPRGGLAADEAEAVDLAREIGFPVALKLAWPGALHKTDRDAVALGLDSEAEVRRAHQRLTSRAAQPIDGVLIEEMVTGGQEMLVSRFHDETFGPAVAVGCGGLLADLLEDTCLLIPPFGREEARTAILGLRAARLLSGYRGRPALDLDALVEVACTLGSLDAPGLQLLEINPVLVRPAGQGAVALDARLDRSV